MSLYNDIKLRINVCQKSGESHERDTLRTVIGEAQLNASRKGQGSVSDEDLLAVLKKSKQNIEETIIKLENSYGATDRLVPDIWHIEIAIYNKFLPQYMTIDEMVKRINEYPMDAYTPIVNAKSDGQATGVAMKFFKEHRLSVQGQDVTVVVKKIREWWANLKKEQEANPVVLQPLDPEKIKGTLAEIKMKSFPILDTKPIVEG